MLAVTQLLLAQPNIVYCHVQASLLVGGAGTAKTSIINLFLSRFNPEEASSKTITFSYLTTPQIFQMSVEVSFCLHAKKLVFSCFFGVLNLASDAYARQGDHMQGCQIISPQRRNTVHQSPDVLCLTSHYEIVK